MRVPFPSAPFPELLFCKGRRRSMPFHSTVTREGSSFSVIWLMPALLRVRGAGQIETDFRNPTDYTFVRPTHHLRRRILDEVPHADPAIGDIYLSLRDGP